MRADPAPVAAAPGGGPRTGGRALVWLSLLSALLAQGLLLGILFPVLADGRLMDIDGYSRLVRVAELHEHGRWYDALETRANAPFGVMSHWTRPLDGLLLAGAQALAPAVGFERALFWWGVVLSPLLYVLATVLLVRASGLLLPARARLLLLIAVPMQLALLMDSAPGLPDHHALIMLVEVAALSATLRMLARPPEAGRAPTALVAGALLALGVWVSTEFLPAALLFTAGLALGWVLRGGDRARRNAQHALGLLAGSVVALALERPPSEWLALEVDRLSALHVGLALVDLVIWSVLALATARHEWSLRTRLIAIAVAAVPLALVVARVAGSVLEDAEMASDPLTEAFNSASSTFQSLWPVDGPSTARFLIYLGAPALALPYVWAMTRSHRGQPLGEAWLVLAVLATGHLVGALALTRLAASAELLLLIPLAGLASAWLERVERLGRGWQRTASAALGVAGLLLGPLAAGAFLMRDPPVATGPQPLRPNDLRALYSFLEARPGLGEHALTILSLPRDAPELLYRTQHSTVAYPHHRGLDSIRESLTFYATTDEAVAHEIVRRHLVDLVVVPKTAAALTPVGPASAASEANAPAAAGPSFAVRLLFGVTPSWLQRVSASEADAAGVALFRVSD